MVGLHHILPAAISFVYRKREKLSVLFFIVSFFIGALPSFPSKKKVNCEPGYLQKRNNTCVCFFETVVKIIEKLVEKV
jgi:hypothetical protein